jgi:hypothetical protein
MPSSRQQAQSGAAVAWALVCEHCDDYVGYSRQFVSILVSLRVAGNPYLPSLLSSLHELQGCDLASTQLLHSLNSRQLPQWPFRHSCTKTLYE